MSRLISSQIERSSHSASHVEVSFKDTYLTRADMWRLVVSELANKSVYKGQKVLFLGTIKAEVKTIYIQSKKTQSAFFDPTTKPIFRSESARYVLFIQMSKEMWDFDTDGTGEIMFHKVINGFLPELFKRWQSIGARHLVSIILFTRLQYERRLSLDFERSNEDIHNASGYSPTNKTPYKDFYRVVVSDMASGQWSAILRSLKKEFKVFLRDVSICKASSNEYVPWAQEGISIPQDTPVQIIAGTPTPAIRGNVLEAINLASSQFSEDYIDRDLVRTGLSIVIITPGTGVFEVDRNLLITTTDNLIENGIGIDLICLSRIPLHSVPLFKYRAPTHHAARPRDNAKAEISHVQPNEAGSFRSLDSSINTSQLSEPKSSFSRDQMNRGDFDKDHWLYAMPQWVDISFWTASMDDGVGHTTNTSTFSKRTSDPSKRDVFVPRIRMYEVQMMGIMENEMRNISIPYMYRQPSGLPDGPSARVKNKHFRAQHSTTSLSASLEMHGSGIDHSKNSPAPSLSSSRSPHQASTMKRYGSLIRWMDTHDDLIFRHPQRRKALHQALPQEQSITRTGFHNIHKHGGDSSSKVVTPVTGSVSNGYGEDQAMKTERVKLGARETKNSIAKSISSARPSQSKTKPRNLSRQISFGLRGFGGMTAKATAVAEMSSETAQSTSLLTRGLQSRDVAKKQFAQSILPESAEESLSSDHERERVGPKMSSLQSSVLEQASKPISIRSPYNRSGIPRTSLRLGADDNDVNLRTQDDLSNEHLDTHPAEDSIFLPPNKATTPWLTVLNPSNPHKTSTDPTRRLGRWYHVFPYTLRASKLKWKSLCSPASVPLTTEDFPSPDDFPVEYQSSEYKVSPGIQHDITEDNGWLMSELISARLSRGFQFVVGARLSEATGVAAPELIEIYGVEHDGLPRTKLYMSKGNTIHQLSKLAEGSVEVKQFRRSLSSVTSAEPDNKFVHYQPSVKTTLSGEYKVRSIKLALSSERYDWQRLDTFIAGHEEQHADQYPESLHFWRARFVFLPVEGAISSKRLLRPTSNDNEEEIRLEGIHRITQLFNRYRFAPLDERRFQGSVRKSKDPNPLDIIYQTRNPSAIVAAEMSETLLMDNDTQDGRPAHLLPDNDLFERSNLNLRSLAQTIQSDRGIKMMDRRWHWRLHYNCFIGFELTTWLLNNFKDIDSREEAVDFGRELLKGGFFQHVEKRHDFRDGNFFYQIATDYRLPRPESRNTWFGGRRYDRSVPSTPVAESMMTNYNDLPGSQSSSTSNERMEEGLQTPKAKPRLGVTLSKRLIYDVDHKKRSYRRELINLHYDKISSADDCYHLRIDWLNVTPKLIEDAIVTWATAAESYGLRLVELPIGEASRINEIHPFRAPYMVKLAKWPPEKEPQNYFDANSLTPKAMSEFPYHKAILKKHNFVLDLEAAKDFPPSVDVTYSWGKPDYCYTQYVSREGVLLAQITDEGDFLLLANRLYNNRSAAAREANRGLITSQHEHSNGSRASPVRHDGNPYLATPRASPQSSPLIRATPDVGPGFAQMNITTPERIAYDLEAFCNDIKALDSFYDEVLNKTITTAPSTPPAESTMTNLGPPPALSLRDVSPASRLQSAGGGRAKLSLARESKNNGGLPEN